jgi:hypothetical protein
MSETILMVAEALQQLLDNWDDVVAMCKGEPR